MNNISGWWLTHPSEKWWSSSDWIIIPTMENNKCSKPPTRFRNGLYHLSKLFCNNAINYPFGNSNHATYQNWWWLGDGLWHCFNHIIGQNYGNLELRQWQVCSKKIHGMLLPMTGLTCGAETEQSPAKNKFAIAIRRSNWGLNRNPGQDSWFSVPSNTFAGEYL